MQTLEEAFKDDPFHEYLNHTLVCVCNRSIYRCLLISYTGLSPSCRFMVLSQFRLDSYVDKSYLLSPSLDCESRRRSCRIVSLSQSLQRHHMSDSWDKHVGTEYLGYHHENPTLRCRGCNIREEFLYAEQGTKEGQLTTHTLRLDIEVAISRDTKNSARNTAKLCRIC